MKARETSRRIAIEWRKFSHKHMHQKGKVGSSSQKFPPWDIYTNLREWWPVFLYGKCNMWKLRGVTCSSWQRLVQAINLLLCPPPLPLQIKMSCSTIKYWHVDQLYLSKWTEWTAKLKISDVDPETINSQTTLCIRLEW